MIKGIQMAFDVLFLQKTIEAACVQQLDVVVEDIQVSLLKLPSDPWTHRVTSNERSLYDTSN